MIIAGVTVGGCVESTARDAVSRDYHVIMLSDGTAGAGLLDLGWGEVDSQTLSRVFLSNFRYHFGQVISVGELITAIAPKKETYAS